MRILAITNLYPNPLQPNRGVFNRQQWRALAQRGHDVRVISPIAWTDEWAARRRGATGLSPHRVTRCDGLRVCHPQYLYPPKVLRHWYGHFFRHSARPAFARAVDRFQPDVVLAAWAYPDGWAAVDLAHRAGLPAVVKVHGSDLLTLPRVAGRARRTAEALCRADAVIAVSRDLAAHAVEMGASPERISVVYDGIDTERFHPGPRAEARAALGIVRDEPVILFVGNLVSVKRVNVLIDACARLIKRSVHFRCFVIGQGPLRQQLERQAQRQGLTDRVTFVGPVAHAALPNWYRAADVFVLPSASEGVPCVLLEAAACQTSYVATRVGGINEIAHLNHGMLVEPDDSPALAEAIALTLARPHARDARGAHRRTHDDAAREIETILHRVARPSPQLKPTGCALVGAPA